MEKIEITLERVRAEVEALNDPKKWRFTTVNAVDTGAGYEVQWIFAAIGQNLPVKMLFCAVDYNTVVPSVADLIPAAHYGEAEMLDLLGVKFENAQGGIFLEPDTPRAPLRKPHDQTA